MPNYSIPESLRQHIRNQAVKLATRPLELALRNFPLDMAAIQDHCTALTQEQIATMRELSEQGVRTIEQHTQLRLAFIRNVNMPELRRSVVVELRLPASVFVGRGTQWGIATTKFKDDEKHYIVPELVDLNPELRSELVSWIDKALRQTRLYEITDYCVNAIMDEKLSPTTSHLHAVWPTLTTLVDPSEVFVRSRERVEVWRERFRNPTKSLRAYQPHIHVKQKFAKLITAADTMLSAGRIFGEVQDRRRVIHATIEHWERIAGDPTFPLPD